MRMAPPTRGNRSNSSSDVSLTLEQKIDLLLNDVTEIKNSNASFNVDIKEIKDDIKQFKKDISDSIDMCYEKVKDCNNLALENKNNIGKNQLVVENLISENIFLKTKVKELEKTARSVDQYSRSNCLEIQGVPEIKGERIMDVVKRVAHVLNFELRENMIDAVHRLSRNPNNLQNPRGIILKFCRRLDMEQMRGKTRVKNGFSAAEMGFQSENKVYVNMSLTRETRVLWGETRAFKARHNYRYSWITSAGKIFLRKEEGSPAILITEKDDLNKLQGT